MIRDYFRRRRIRKVFSKVASPDAIDKLLSGEHSFDSLQQGPLEFVIVAARGDSPTQISEHMGTVCDIAINHKALIDCMFSSVVMIIYGSGPSKQNLQNSQNRLNLVKAIETAMTDRVKMVHGAGSGTFGLIGSKERLAYSFILPGFLEAIAALSTLEFGATKEIELNSRAR